MVGQQINIQDEIVALNALPMDSPLLLDQRTHAVWLPLLLPPGYNIRPSLLPELGGGGVHFRLFT